MTYETEQVQNALEEYGELLVVLDSDAYAEPLELHLHDTDFNHDYNEIELTLSDGSIGFKSSSIESMTYHTHSTADYGL